jgi:hypothetical protein
MKITIFGSCRQDSLYDHYKITNIKNNLTYPHYSKEVVQAIEFCKGISTISPTLTKSIFRSGILSRTIMHPGHFTADFMSTDLFVIEIASRISYNYNGYYAHHILSEPQYGCPDISNIIVRDLTDGEIEEDILRIKGLLHPKPFIIVGHIYTRKTGKRYELVQLLKRLCSIHNIPFFDPVIETAGLLPEKLYHKEDTLAHYSHYGHSIIGKKYCDFISLVLGNKNSSE